MMDEVYKGNDDSEEKRKRGEILSWLNEKVHRKEGKREVKGKGKGRKRA